MRRSLSVFNTDRPNRHRMIIPASELVSAEHKHRRVSQKYGLPVGLPVHVQHDMHRFTGWSKPLGVYIDNEMVRSIGIVEQPDTDEEKDDLNKRANVFWQHHHSIGAEPFKSDLIARAAPADLSNAAFISMEASVAKRKGIASELYPHLFDPSSDYVDKDGLLDYAYLKDHFRLLQPGIYLDEGRKLLLFAHCFWRRSLSHRNKLNNYFLQSYDAAAEGKGALRARLRLDADVIGHPDSVKHLIELEYWHGPQYSDDIARIPKGVAEHKADEATRYYEGVDRTQFWWKAPESRSKNGGQTLIYRTFEAEELIEDPSGGLPNGEYGCRYVHSEFSADERNITHFDGAIRAYGGAEYLQRIDTAIDRAGKHAAYTKLFRFDGVIEIPLWKRLVGDFFRGNSLIPEYFGGSTDADDGIVDRAAAAEQPSLAISQLAALISMRESDIRSSTQLIAEHSQAIGALTVPFVEIGTGEVANYIRNHIDLAEVMAVGIIGCTLNLSPLHIAHANQMKQEFDRIVIDLSGALETDAVSGNTKHVSSAFCWEGNGLTITLSLIGDAIKLAQLLAALPQVVDPTKETIEWVEPLAERVRAIASGPPSQVHWFGVERGLLRFEREGVVRQQMLVQDALKERLIAEGLLSAEEALELVNSDPNMRPDML